MNCGTASKKNLVWLVLRLSLPSMGAQISSVVMQYIDAAMVGHLDTDSAAAVGLVAGVTWLFGGLCTALTTGFTVQAAQAAGAGEEARARGIMRHGLWTALAVGASMAMLGLCLSSRLPVWLRADWTIHEAAVRYFRIYALSMPFVQLNGYGAGMLQSGGNMRIPGLLTMGMYGMDVLFNFFLIFPARSMTLLGTVLFLPGAGLGAEGAALGTALSETITALLMLYFLLLREPSMRLRRGEPFFTPGFAAILKRTVRLGSPIALEQVVMRFAQLTVTGMIASLGNAAVAAHSLAITAESVCYMPAYGIDLAQVAITGRGIGSGDKQRTRQMGWAGIGLGSGVTLVLAVLMFCFAPQLMGLLTPEPELIRLGTVILRIEAFAEVPYAVHLICSGILRGRGDTFVSSTMVLGCMWLVRVPLTMLLIPHMGLAGAWLAMSIELCIRGAVFLLRFQFSGR